MDALFTEEQERKQTFLRSVLMRQQCPLSTLVKCELEMSTENAGRVDTGSVNHSVSSLWAKPERANWGGSLVDIPA